MTIEHPLESLISCKAFL